MLVITGQSEPQLEQNSGINGAQAVLHKPFSLMELADVLEVQLFSGAVSMAGEPMASAEKK